MKKSKITLLTASLLCLAMGVGGALAVNYVHATRSYEGSVDNAIYLYWGSSKEATADIEPITTLTELNDVYRYVACESVATTALSGKVEVGFVIAGVEDSEHDDYFSLDGLTVAVYKTTTLQNDSTRDLTSPAATLLFTLDFDDVDKREDSDEFNVSGGTGSSYYCLKFMYDGSPAPTDYEWGGTMTISQTYKAA